MLTKVYRRQWTQALPISLDLCWAFFSNPRNLPLITPPWLDFQMSAETPTTIYAGLIFMTQVRPMLGLPMRWVTEITQAREPVMFIDEQRFGPYKFWHHQHHFKEIAGGVENTDLIHYSIPFGPLGRVLNPLFVRRSLTEIFQYRERKLIELFGEFTAP